MLSKVIENSEIATIFTLCFKLFNDEAIFSKAVRNPNASLLIQNVLDCEYLQ